jgi:hypothetical protein
VEPTLQLSSAKLMPWERQCSVGALAPVAQTLVCCIAELILRARPIEAPTQPGRDSPFRRACRFKSAIRQTEVCATGDDKSARRRRSQGGNRG